MADRMEKLAPGTPHFYENDEVTRALMVLMNHFARSGEQTSQGIDADPWMTPAEAARYASVSDDTLRSWIQTGHLPAGRQGRIIRVKRSDIDRFLRGGHEDSTRSPGLPRVENDSRTTGQRGTNSDSTGKKSKAAQEILQRLQKRRE